MFLQVFRLLIKQIHHIEKKKKRKRQQQGKGITIKH